MPNEHYYAKVPFRAVVRIAQEQGDKIIVGFDGGRGALRRSDKAYLIAREYKYDWSEKPIGNKIRSHWIPGREFISMLVELGIVDES